MPEKIFKVVFYQDARGKEPVKEFIQKIARQDSKNSRIQLNKIRDYIQLLEIRGIQPPIDRNIVKKLEGEIWELRPLQNRILFAAFHQNQIVLLHAFVKKTQKTPRKEIEKAKAILKDLKQRENENGNHP